ncbi:hypothetical protein HNP89_001456 [Methanococcus maripaludis]|uniref:Uncharacterized protein n=1 Tax=Methanococcus maripaludis TaxID=39152 RepID=A0A7J9P0J4_METMI|nr:hypothetical protein [Methanococcus maripaludis]MBA2853480.1 hypothetical protein [Methanococcus maripaludis]
MEFKNQFDKFLLSGILGAGILIKYFLHPEYGLNLVYIGFMVICFSISLFYGISYIFLRILQNIVKDNKILEKDTDRFTENVEKIIIKLVNIIKWFLSTFFNLFYLIFLPYKLVKNFLTDNIQKRTLKTEFPYYLIATVALIMIIALFMIMGGLFKFFTILNYFEKSDLVCQYLRSSIENPTFNGFIVISAILIGYFSLIGHVKSNKAYFRDLDDLTLKGYLEMIFGTYDLLIFIYWVLTPYLLLNHYFLEFFVLLLTLSISKGLFSPVLSKYNEYISKYDKIEFHSSSMNILKNGARAFGDVIQSAEESEWTTKLDNVEELEKEISEKKIDTDTFALDLSMVGSGQKPRYKLTDQIYNKFLLDIKENFLKIIERYGELITTETLFNWITCWLLHNASYFSNIFMVLPFLIVYFGLNLKFNLISIAYMIISSFYCFTVLCVLSRGLPEKETVFLKNGEIIKNGYILEDNPKNNYMVIALPNKKIRVMKDSILKIEASLELSEKLDIKNKTK